MSKLLNPFSLFKGKDKDDDDKPPAPLTPEQMASAEEKRKRVRRAQRASGMDYTNPNKPVGNKSLLGQ